MCGLEEIRTYDPYRPRRFVPDPPAKLTPKQGDLLAMLAIEPLPVEWRRGPGAKLVEYGYAEPSHSGFFLSITGAGRTHHKKECSRG